MWTTCEKSERWDESHINVSDYWMRQSFMQWTIMKWDNKDRSNLLQAINHTQSECLLVYLGLAVKGFSTK